ncbi:HD-GYP domain-containing protein [Natronospira bacteriovora]|uniref:HD-GYP domain-containing protein n=1 Tax=Natronospira bacteriovora TaxID=3069753 RepID=A0ABU0W4L7_9GAMM|nr:HD-GYP domain-containing protein [Natronospira sp. AB-CW4]MDQ2068912.1 HD-GYP domain-containing protein [Natronospira sp. AB-CW4]
MKRIQVAVEDLRLGMYVAELDRPWLDSPFLFQGFLLERQEDLTTIRSLCRHVLVDEALSTVSDHTGSHSSTSGHERVVASSRPGVDSASPRTSRVVQLDPKRILSAVQTGHDTRQRTHGYLKTLFRDLRLGHTVDTEEARGFVSQMVDAITDYPDVAIWLTQMKNKDEYTSLHCLNVCVLTVAFCRHLGYSRTDLETIGIGALLHDIGKSKTPEHILNKPGRLSPEEWQIMQRHPEDGYRMMQEAGGDIPDVALQIIRGHHRRVNGAGYPEQFPLGELDVPVLTVAIADVYDAMTSERCYHQAMAADEVLRLMRKGAGQTFGRELMEDFIRCVGIFPVGSVVELGNGSLALVISPGRSERLLPQVLMLRDAHGHRLEQRKLVDLAVAVRNRPGQDWQIRRVVEPGQHGIGGEELTLADLPS